jgi:hypothetical protein
MKGPRANILIAAMILAIIALLLFSNFEYKLVKDEDWKEDYHPKSKKNYGLLVFEDLLKKKLGEENVVTDYNLKINSLQDTNLAIFIFYSKTSNMSYKGINDYDSLLAKGNDLYLFSNNLDFIHNDLYFKPDTFFDLAILDTIVTQDGKKIGFDLSKLSTKVDSFQKLNVIKVESYNDYEQHQSYDDDYQENASEEDTTYTSEEQETALVDTLLTDSTLTDTTLTDTTWIDSTVVEETIDLAVQDSINKVIESNIDTLLSYHGKPVFQKMKVLNGYVYTHTFPLLVSNVSTKNLNAYAEHFNVLLKDLKGKKVIITAGNLSSENDNPLEVLLRNKALALAYYTTLFSLLLYLIFASKRLQRPIPITEPVKNTSLEYIHTLARLYDLQGINYKLVLKMKENFYHMIAKRYYISQEDENFVQHLSKKSKIKEELLNATVKYFEHIEKNKVCSDEQLEMLNIYLSKIENHINHGNNQ